MKGETSKHFLSIWYCEKEGVASLKEGQGVGGEGGNVIEFEGFERTKKYFLIALCSIKYYISLENLVP